MPANSVLGEVDRGFAHMMQHLPRERISTAVGMRNAVIDACVQLHGGYGYMREYDVAQAWMDARVTRIWGGTNEIMRLIISRDLGLEPGS